MPYVRTRGNQVAIVHGERHPETRQVEQRVLFTFYTREELEAAAGRLGAGEARFFQTSLEERYPALRFDWPRLRHELEARLAHLPSAGEAQRDQAARDLDADLGRLARRVVAADPLAAPSLAATLATRRGELEILREWLGFRLATLARLAPEASDRVVFRWDRLRQEDEVSSDIEEVADERLRAGDLDGAEAQFRLLVALYPRYAEGWNYLGLIALERRDHDEAIACFERTMAVGRANLPKRVARSRWWLDHATRPYMRGLRNLTLTLVRAGRYRDALALCAQLERECGDEVTAASHRAAAHLGLAEWEAARAAALRIREHLPGESLVAAFAAFELGDEAAATIDFVHAVMNGPRAVGLVLDRPAPPPASADEAEDHNHGVDLAEALAGYLARRSPPARRFFSRRWDALAAARQEVLEAEARWRERRDGSDRLAFDRMMEMRSVGFARRLAPELGA